jgi:hypothetical protein
VVESQSICFLGAEEVSLQAVWREMACLPGRT